MAITFDWNGYNSQDGSGAWSFNISSTNVFGFYGAGFGTPIQVGQYNTEMHIRAGVQTDTDSCNTPHLTGIKYGGTATTAIVNGGSTVDINVDNMSEEDCIQVKVQSDTAITILQSRLYAYNATNVEVAPANLDFKAFVFATTVSGDAGYTWKDCGGRQSALLCGARATSLQSHYYYVGMTIKPLSTGASTLFVVRFEADIQ